MSKEKITTPLPKGVELVSEELAWPMAIAGDEFRTKAAQSRKTLELKKDHERIAYEHSIEELEEAASRSIRPSVRRGLKQNTIVAREASEKAHAEYNSVDREQLLQAREDFGEKPVDPDFHVGPWPAAYDAGERAAKYDARASVLEEQARREAESAQSVQKGQ